MFAFVRRVISWVDSSPSTVARWLRAARSALLGEMTTYAAGTALFAILATVPTLAAVVAIYSYVADPRDIHHHLQGLEQVIPLEVVRFLQDQLERAADNSSGELGIAIITSLAVAIYSARGAASSLIDALNHVYRVRDTRSGVHRLGVALVLAAAAIVGIVIMMAVVVALPGLVAMADLRGYHLVSYARWPVLAVMLFLAAAAVYRFAPSPRPLGKRFLFSGAFIATLLLIASSYGLSMWVDNVADYQLFYGAFASVIVLVLWFYLAIVALLVGGFVNAELERHFGAPAPHPLFQ